MAVTVLITNWQLHRVSPYTHALMEKLLSVLLTFREIGLPRVVPTSCAVNPVTSCASEGDKSV